MTMNTITHLTEGERWIREELALLRDCGRRPRALVRFLWAAQQRTNSTRRGRPGLARQAGAWTLAGGAGWVLAARLLPSGPFARARASGLIWWAGCAVMLDWHLGMLETPAGSAVGLGPADALTLIRAWLVPAVAQGGQPALLLLGSLTDIADGAVARATRCTRLGRDLEGVVDACFFAAALRGATRAGALSPLPAALERARLLAGGAYVTVAYFAAARAPDPAVPRGGRAGAPVRIAALLAAGLGHRAIADRLLLAGSGVAIAEVLCSDDARRAVSAIRRP